MTPRGKQRLEYAIYAGIVVFVCSLPLVRCLLLRHRPGRAASARIETRDGGPVLVVVDELCTGGGKDIPQCDTRTIVVSLPDGKKLEQWSRGGHPSDDATSPCASRIPIGGEWVNVDADERSIGLSRSAVPGAAEGAWSVRLRGGCQVAAIVGDTLVVATTDGARRAVGIDVATGAQRWVVRP